jgi:hypothetical protein
MKADQYIRKLAELQGDTLTRSDVRRIRTSLETTYLNDLLDGRQPFSTVKGATDVETERDRTRENAATGQASRRGPDGEAGD